MSHLNKCRIIKYMASPARRHHASEFIYAKMDCQITSTVTTVMRKGTRVLANESHSLLSIGSHVREYGHKRKMGNRWPRLRLVDEGYSSMSLLVAARPSTISNSCLGDLPFLVHIVGEERGEHRRSRPMGQ